MAQGGKLRWLGIALAGAAGLVALMKTQVAAAASSGGAGSSGGGGPPSSGSSGSLSLNALNGANSTLAQRREAFAPYFAEAEDTWDIPTGLLLAQGIQESQLIPSARSSAGAVGIMQLEPRYFPGAGLDAVADINTAAQEMARLYGVFNAWSLALAGYNAGQTRVTDAGPAVPAIAETQNYVTRIMAAAGLSEPDVAWA